ncbi:MAG TPA: 3-deoxy-7-phosphoheptulonate synthase [Polyangia bacterium]|nr:3-deoxy-7-phosphoheptulonate synthase [Polyangia bacterium]
MIVLLRAGASRVETRAVEAELARAGASARTVRGSGRVAVEVVGPHAPLDDAAVARIAALDAVESILDADEPNPRVAAARGPVTIDTPVGPLAVGGDEWTLMLGPCAVENEPDLVAAAAAAQQAGARFLRGGAFKPRTSPYAFQGLGDDGLPLLRRVADDFGLAVVSEATSEAAVARVAEHCELIQIGARTMAASSLLKAAARAGRPVLLKRGFGATVDEWLAAAEYLLDGGAPGVILCERGIRSFEPGTRATLDLGGLVLAKLRTGLPVIADPSHAAGTRALVEPLARAALAAGADGLIVECHAEPGRARSDGPQALPPDEVAALARAVARLAPALGRRAPKPLSCTNACQLQTTTSAPRSSASPR